MEYPELPVILRTPETDCHFRMKFEDGVYLVKDDQDSERGAIARRPDGSWYRHSGMWYPDAYVEQLGTCMDNFEYLTAHSFGFGLELDGELLYGEVILGEHGYCIYLNCEFVAEIRMNFSLEWESVCGILPAGSLLDEIGSRIERHFLQR